VIVDASALLAILLEEPDGGAMQDMLLAPRRPHEISPVNYLEAALRVDRWPASNKSAELDPSWPALESRSRK